MEKDTGLSHELNKAHPTITAEQAKLLENSLRIKILHALNTESRTSKQVAVLLGRTPGNVHYHIQKLFAGGFLELTHTQTAGGVIEKYYRSIGTAFQSPGFEGHRFIPGSAKRQFYTSLALSAEDLAEFSGQLDRLLEQWEAKNTHGPEYGVSITVGLIESDDATEPG